MRVPGRIAEESATAQVELTALLSCGNAAKQFVNMVVGNGRAIEDANLAAQEHHRGPAVLEAQFGGSLLSGQVEQILHAVHPRHLLDPRAPSRGMQWRVERKLWKTLGVSGADCGVV